MMKRKENSWAPGNYFFIMPLIAMVPWTGMLMALLIAWGVQGHPIYWFMDHHQDPVYLSDIGATNLRPLFISCSGWQGLWFCLFLVFEYYQRSGMNLFTKNKKKNNNLDNDNDDTFAVTNDENQLVSDMSIRYDKILASQKFYMPPWYTKDERNLMFAAFCLAVIGQLGLLFCTIFSTAHYHHVHLSMVGIFIAFTCLAICCNAAEYFLMGKRYALLHPLAGNINHIKYNDLRWYQWKGKIWNKFTLSATIKMCWLTLAVVFAICFGACDSRSTRAAFEWVLCFWYAFYFILISIDFYLGSRYTYSKYFHQIHSFDGYYKYNDILAKAGGNLNADYNELDLEANIHGINNNLQNAIIVPSNSDSEIDDDDDNHEKLSTSSSSTDQTTIQHGNAKNNKSLNYDDTNLGEGYHEVSAEIPNLVPKLSSTEDANVIR